MTVVVSYNTTSTNITIVCCSLIGAINIIICGNGIAQGMKMMVVMIVCVQVEMVIGISSVVAI